MSNPLLNYGSGGGDLTALSNGSFDVNAGSIKDQSLVPGMPLRTNANKQLVTGLIGPRDISFAVLQNPLNDNFEVLGKVYAENIVPGGLDLNQFAATVGSDVLDLKTTTTKINYFGGVTTFSGILRAPDILAHSILDAATGTELLNIDQDNVDIYSQAFTYNGDDVATDATVAAAIAVAVAGLEGDGTKVQNLTAVPGTSTFIGLVEADDIAVGTHASVETALITLEDKAQNITATPRRQYWAS